MPGLYPLPTLSLSRCLTSRTLLRFHAPLELNDEEQRLYERLADCFDQERKRVAKLLADKDDSNLLGQTEFDLRDRGHALGAKALEVVASSA